jgi:hypothetical protein
VVTLTLRYGRLVVTLSVAVVFILSVGQHLVESVHGKGRYVRQPPETATS